MILGIVGVVRAIAATGNVLAAEAGNDGGEENGERENPAHDRTHPWGAKRNCKHTFRAAACRRPGVGPARNRTRDRERVDVSSGPRPCGEPVDPCYQPTDSCRMDWQDWYRHAGYAGLNGFRNCGKMAEV